MAVPDLPAGEIREDRLAAGYVFFGEEDYLAEDFILRLRRALISPEAQALGLESFDLSQTRWPEIIDTARTTPFFFSPWRIVVARTCEEGKPEKEAKEGSARLSSLDEKIIREYFRNPASKTVLVVVISGAVKRTHALVRFFGSLDEPAVVLVEMKRLKPAALRSWMSGRLAASGKSATPEALARLEEAAGNDLRRLDREIEKVAVFVGERKVISIEDIYQVCDWTKSYYRWDLADAMKKPDLRQSLLILRRSFEEGEAPEVVLGGLAGLFRDLLLAKLWLKEGRDRKEIFAFFKPQIKPSWGMYQQEIRSLFSLVERMTLGEMRWALRELEEIDLLIKTTGAAAEPLLDRFVVEYCRRSKKSPERRGPIWKATG